MINITPTIGFVLGKPVARGETPLQGLRYGRAADLVTSKSRIVDCARISEYI